MAQSDWWTDYNHEAPPFEESPFNSEDDSNHSGYDSYDYQGGEVTDREDRGYQVYLGNEEWSENEVDSDEEDDDNDDGNKDN